MRRWKYTHLRPSSFVLRLSSPSTAIRRGNTQQPPYPSLSHFSIKCSSAYAVASPTLAICGHSLLLPGVDSPPLLEKRHRGVVVVSPCAIVLRRVAVQDRQNAVTAVRTRHRRCILPTSLLRCCHLLARNHRDVAVRPATVPCCCSDSPETHPNGPD
ncbi:hypothetical protein AAHA92_02988 [Salvia divinorum]|uniref:Uncharacterized protein n=1 Tax=Salvia divinorum TaxID=28513 RepID=A0ABD1IFM6_SALDI